MSLTKSGVKKGNPRVQDPAPSGMIDKVIPTNHVENVAVKLPVSMNYQARKLALSSILKAEYRKAQALTLIRQRDCIR